MPRPRDPRREEAKEAWLKSKGEAKLKDIASYLGVTSSTIRKWKAQDNWEDELKGSAPKLKRSAPKRGRTGAPNGNKNAEGNKGGPPPGNKNAVGNSGGAAPIGNKNALVTGEYESILFDTLTEEEQIMFGVIDTSPVGQIDENIRVLSIRERRMMERIRSILSGLTETEKRILKERISVKVPVESFNDRTGKFEIKTAKQDQLVVTEEEETTYRKIDDVLKLEEALTRIQGRKQAAIKLKHEIGSVFEQHKLEQLQLSMDKMKVEVAKVEAEAEIAINKAEKLTSSGKVNELLKALLDVKAGGDGSGTAEVQRKADSEHKPSS
ncbi:phage terminase small subunit [Bacillus sp. JCM 19034]|uniref:phage terminase small subunit n=1 Tax=Bacillus sp. JCM 19034 TaxID=1481928 RepID=UPI0009EC8E97|nr:phage terminase small subunit [Bacillus sp. JCM 19034]